MDTFPESAPGPIGGRWGTGRLRGLCADGLADGIGSTPLSSLGGKGEEEGIPRLYHTESQ